MVGKNEVFYGMLAALLASGFALTTFGANAFEHVGGCVDVETLGEVYLRNGDLAQTVGALTHFAEKVGVVVGQSEMAAFLTATVLCAESVFGLPASVFHAVYDVVVQEKCESAEDGRLVYGDELVFQIVERYGTGAFRELPKDKQPHRSGFHAPHLQSLF